MKNRNGFIPRAAVVAAIGFTAISCLTAWGEWGGRANAELVKGFGYWRYPLAGLLSWLIWIIVNHERKTLIWMYAAAVFIFTGASLSVLRHGGFGYVLAYIGAGTARYIGDGGLYFAAVTLCAAPATYRKRRALAGRAEGFKGFFEDRIKPELDNFRFFVGADDGGGADASAGGDKACKRLQAVFDGRHVDATVVNSMDQFSTVKYFVRPGAGGFAAVRNLKDDIELKLRNTVDIDKENGFITVTVNKAAGQKQAPKLGLWLRYVQANKDPLALPVGIDSNGQPLFVDLFSESHLLIGGGSGSGKTTWLCSAILGLAMMNTPDDGLEMLLVDGKESDLAVLNPLPHLVMDVILDNTRVGIAVEYIENEIAYRKSLKRKGITRFKPFLFLVDEIDEIIRCDKSLMKRITGISGQARSFNILIIITAKHPKGDMIDSGIKANFLTRLCLKVADAPASQLILGQGNIQGAKLTGKGDFILLNDGEMIRGQGYFINEKTKNEVSGMVRQIANTYEPIPRMPFGGEDEDLLDDGLVDGSLVDDSLVDDDDMIDIYRPNEKMYRDTVSYQGGSVIPISRVKRAVSGDTPRYGDTKRRYDAPIQYFDTESDTADKEFDATDDTPDYTDDTDERVMDLISQGVSYRKTGDKLGLSLAKVQRIVAKNKNRLKKVN